MPVADGRDASLPLGMTQKGQAGEDSLDKGKYFEKIPEWVGSTTWPRSSPGRKAIKPR
jgi:hypothetical protein